jgi:AraC-like DNA-binding protein
MKTFSRYFSTKPLNTDEGLGISISTLGHHVHPQGEVYPQGSHPESYFFNWNNGRYLPEYQLLYITKGKGTFEATGLPPIEIAAGTIMLVYPDIWHRYKPNEDTGWEEYWVGFSGAYAKYLLEQACFNAQSPIIQVGLNAEIEMMFEKLLDVMESEEEAKRKLTSFILIQLLGIVYTSVLLSNKTLSKKEKIVDDVKKAINLRWQESLDFEKLAEEQNTSYSWLRKVFKEVAGTSLNQYHLMIQLRKAEQMIVESDQTLSEIAAACGFESIFYFSRIFKKKMGVNPSELRS